MEAAGVTSTDRFMIFCEINRCLLCGCHTCHVFLALLQHIFNQFIYVFVIPVEQVGYITSLDRF